MDERRASPRLEGHYRVAVTVLAPKTGAGGEEEESRTLFCSTEDISSEGIRFTSNRSIPVGTAMDLLVVLTWSYYGFQHRGRVAWVIEDKANQSYVIGVKLTESPKPTQIAWRQALDARFDTAGKAEAENGPPAEVHPSAVV